MHQEYILKIYSLVGNIKMIDEVFDATCPKWSNYDLTNDIC